MRAANAPSRAATDEMLHVTGRVSSQMKFEMASYATLPTASASSVSLTSIDRAYGDDDACAPLETVGADALPSGLTRVRSATLCTDTLRNLSSVTLNTMVHAESVMRDSSRNRSVDKLDRTVVHADSFGQGAFDGPAAAASRHGANDATPIYNLPHATWILPHPVAVPPTDEEYAQEANDMPTSVGLSLASLAAPPAGWAGQGGTAAGMTRERSYSNVEKLPMHLEEDIRVVNPLHKASSGMSKRHGSSSAGLSHLATQLDLPTNGVRYEVCVICRSAGRCDDDRCCKMPRHVECELANQRANPQKWEWTGNSLRLPCSACRQTWMELAPTDELAVEVVKQLQENHTQATEERRRTLETELLSTPHERRKRFRRVAMTVGFALPASAGAAFLAMTMGPLAVPVVVAGAAAAGVSVGLTGGIVAAVEGLRRNAQMSVAAELAEIQTSMPDWVPHVVKAQRKKELMKSAAAWIRGTATANS